MGTQVTSDMDIPAWDTENTDPASDDKTGESEVWSPNAWLNRVCCFEFCDNVEF